MYEIRQPKPRIEINTDGWTTDECSGLEHFASKWLSDWSTYIHLPVGRLTNSMNQGEPWAVKIAQFLAKHLDAAKMLQAGTHELWIELDYPEDN